MPDPVYTRGPQLQNAFVNKWEPQLPRLSALLERDELTTLMEIDKERVARGSYPLSNQDTVRAIRAMRSKEAITTTPEPEFLGSEILGDALQDVRDIGMGVIKLPQALWHELEDVQDPKKWEEGNIFQKPGFRMLPGSFVLGNLVGGTPEVLKEHPVMTGLDVLPYANKLSELTVGKPLLQATKDASHATVGEVVKKGTGRYPFQPGKMGEASWFDQLGFGRTARNAARLSSEQNRAIQHQFKEEFNARVDSFFEGMDLAEVEKITRIATETPELIPTLSPEQQGVISQVRAMYDELGQKYYEEGKLFPINGEYYPVDTARKMLNAVKTVEEGRASQKAIDAEWDKLGQSEKIVHAQEVIEGIRTPQLHQWVDDLLTNIHRPKQAEAIFHMLEDGGFIDDTLDVGYRQARAAARSSDEVLRESVLADFGDKLHRAVDNPPKVGLRGWSNPAESVASLLEDVDSLIAETTDAGLAKSLRAAKNNLLAQKWSRATKPLRTAGNKMKADPELADIGAYLHNEAYSIERWQRQERLVRNADKARVDARKALSKIEVKQAERDRLLAEIPKMEQRKPPARFMPMLNKRIGEKVQEVAIGKGADPTKVAELVGAGLFSRVKEVSPRELRKIMVDVRNTWTELRDQGYDPVYIHSVSPEQIQQAYHPRILTDADRSPTAVRERTLDAKPYVKNFAVSLKHEASEYLRMKGSQEFQTTIQKTYGKTYDQLHDEYWPVAQKLAASRNADPALIVDQLIARDFSQWRPEMVFPWQPGRSTSMARGDQLYVPKTVDSVLRKIYKESSYPLLQGAWDVGTQAFRISVLALSPRWHVYNVLGGGVMTMAETSPWAVVKHFKEARDMALSGKLPNEISSGLVSMPEDAMYGYLAGKTLGRLAFSIWGEGGLNKAQKIGGALGKPIHASFRFNEIVDNFYRSIAYLDGKSKGGHAKGIELANKVLQDWDSMVPIERTLLRNIFPFYGWMKHILQYVFRYPFDHPIRAAVMSNFARNELEDEGTGLPKIFSQYFNLGNMNAKGEVTAINFRGANPFADVANYFTLAGFLGQLNPVFGAAFQSAGINEITGHAELYPDLEYDANTGQLVPKTISPMAAFIQGTIPQTNLLSILGIGPSEMKELAETDRAAFNQRLWTAAGLPFFPKKMNYNERRALEELKRSDTQQAALSKALKTGQWEDAWQYPSLRPILTRYEQVLESGQLQGTPYLDPLATGAP
jgi:hypothetical protein